MSLNLGRKLIYAIILLKIFLSGSKSWAQDGAESDEELSRAEDEFLRKEQQHTLALASTASYHWLSGVYYRSRQLLIDDSSGTFLEVESYLKEAYPWLRQWQVLKAAFDHGHENRPALSQLLRHLTTELANLNQALLLLQERSKALDHRLEAIAQIAERAIADKLQPTMADYQPTAQFLELRCREIADTARAMQALIKERQKSLEVFYAQGADLFALMMKRAYIDAGEAPLREALNQYHTFLAEQAQWSPVIAEVDRIELELSSAAMDFAWFSGQKLIKAGSSLCQGEPSAKLKAQLSGPFSRRSAQIFTRQCEAINFHAQTFASLDLEPAAMVHEYGQLIAASFLPLCQGKEVALECEKFAILKALKPGVLAGLSLEKLEFIEQEWKQLARHSL